MFTLEESRHLLINIMGIVLTAMLTLNASVDIINAFFPINKTMIATNGIIDNTNSSVKQIINREVQAYNHPQNIAHKATIDKASEILQEFESYIEGINKTLVERAGGSSHNFKDCRPVLYNDKDISTDFFLKEGKGAEIEHKIKEVRAALIALFPDAEKQKQIASIIVLDVEKIPEDSRARTWPEFKFNQVPVAVCIPILTKLVSDAKLTETAIILKVSQKIAFGCGKLDKFKIAIAPRKAFVSVGEDFSADLYFATYWSNPTTDVTFRVNQGAPLALQNGVATYKTKCQNLGMQTMNASASIRNPLTNEIQNIETAFDYEVGMRSAALSADKMKVFYIGVDNPISVAVAGAERNAVKVSGSGVAIDGNDGRYVVTASTPGDATITLSAGGISQKFLYRVKHIPNPVAMLGNGPVAKGGLMTVDEFKAQLGLAAVLENFDFDAKCKIQSFGITRVNKNEDEITVLNSGYKFESDVSNLIMSTKPGDCYLFDEIKALCPGDVTSRNLGSLSFRIR